MNKRTAALFLFDSFADWEPALITAMLTSYAGFEVKTFSVDGESVRSMGGLIVQPHYYLDQLNVEKIDLLILPGGMAWEKNANDAVIPVVKEAADQNKLIAAICAATSLPARLGMLDNIPHTSNSLAYLQSLAPTYRGMDWYEEVAAVHANNIITANGAGFIEMSILILKALNVMPTDELEKVEELYKSGGMVNRLFV